MYDKSKKAITPSRRKCVFFPEMEQGTTNTPIPWKAIGFFTLSTLLSLKAIQSFAEQDFLKK